MNYIATLLTPYLTRSFGRLTVALVLSAFTLLTAQAQSATATLSGTVTDEQGAVVAKADIKAVNDATNLVRKTTTNADGFFTLPLLPPGVYTLNVERDGFAPVGKRDLILNVGDQRSLLIQLRVSGVAAEVTVTSEASLLNESPAVGTVINREFVENLPLNGRSFQSLITLTPGVTLTKPDYSSGGQFSVNGQRGNANYFMVDGVSANIGITTSFPIGQSGGGTLPGFSAAGGTNSLVSVDALQEFRLLTSTFAPEFGRTPGGQVIIVTRSGTNNWRGTLFNYLRNDALDANDWFANRQGVQRAALRQNDFGGVLGGPIVSDRTFFFFSYEGLRLRQPQAGVLLVPSLAARQAAIPSLQPLLNAYPKPNGRTFADGTAEFFGSFSNPATLNATSLRVDHTFTDSLRVFGRYNHAPSNSKPRGAGGASANTITSNEAQTTTATVGATYIFTPRLSNDLRANYSRTNGSTRYELDNFGGAVVPGDSLLFPSYGSRENTNFGFNIGGASSLLAGLSADNRLHQVNVVDDLSYVKGAHQMRFGMDYRRILTRVGSAQFLNYFWFFDGIGNPTPGAARPAGTVLSGTLSEVDIYKSDTVSLGFTNFSAYAQDAWKATPRLTLTYGLRWDINPAPEGLNGKALTALTSVASPAAIAVAPPGTSLYQTRYGNFAPRFGLAYQLRQRTGFETILRVGAGVFYDMGTGTLGEVAAAWPYGTQKFLFDVPHPVQPADLLPTPTGRVLPASGMFADPQLKTPRTYQWNLALEQSLGTSQSVSATYVGAVGRELLRIQRVRAPNANFSGVRALRNDATSDYHALQLQFQRRLSRGLQALISYTWGHSIDVTSTDATYDAYFVRETAGSLNINQRLDRGNSDFDVRHLFSSALSYNLPKLGSGSFARALLSGWALDGVVAARSALPVNLYAGSIVAPDGFGRGSVRPDLVLGQPLYLNDPTAPGGRRFNRAAFAIPRDTPGTTPTRQGTLGRNVLRGFGMSQVDAALRRQFNLTERINLQFRLEAFNLINHPNFGDPGAGGFPGADNINSSLFGLSRGMLGRSLAGYEGAVVGGLNPLYQIGGPRSLQMSLKLNF